MIQELHFYNHFKYVVLPAAVFPEEIPVAAAVKAAMKQDAAYLVIRRGTEIRDVLRLPPRRCSGDDSTEAVEGCGPEQIFLLRQEDNLKMKCMERLFERYDYVLVEREGCVLGIVDTEIKCGNNWGEPYSAINPILECTYDGVMILDKDQKILTANRNIAEIFECPPLEMVGKLLAEMFPAETTEAVTAGGECREPYYFSFHEKNIMGRSVSIFHDGQVYGRLHIFKDVTLQMQRAVDLAETREREESLESIIQSSYDGIYITDSEGLTLMVNKAHERISGIKAEDIVGKYMRDIVDEGLVSSYITDVVVETRAPVTVRQSVSNGKQLIITGSPIIGEDGNVKKVITNVRDVTELIALEKNLQVSQEMADRYRKKLFGDGDEYIVCDSRKFRETIRLAQRVASKDSTVLILGETGVGKEVVAKYIHANSKRKNNHYLTINCGAIPSNLLESELFGYVKGAFTGASQSGKIGLFEMAGGGTLFLDEIGELPLNLQASLLRVLQDGEINRIGEAKSRKVDVRIIAATNRDLEKMMGQDIFRSDLYYRLNVVSILVPPLRERKEDISGLAEFTIEKLNRKYGDKKVITSRFIENLYNREWMGNVREMQNYIEKQFVMTEDEIIDAPHQSEMRSHGAVADPGGGVVVNGILPIKEAVREVERILMERAMRQGKTTYGAAAILGMSQPTFFRKYKELCRERPTEECD